MTANPKSTQLRLLLWKFRQSETKRMMISNRRMKVTTVSVLSGVKSVMIIVDTRATAWDVTDKALPCVFHFSTSETLNKQVKHDYHDPDPVCLVIYAFNVPRARRAYFVFLRKCSVASSARNLEAVAMNAYSSLAVKALVLLSSRMT